MDKRQALINYASSLTTLNNQAGRLVGKCPVHDDNTASFYIYPDSHHATCFGCGFKGDVFDLYQQITGQGFLEAKKALGFWDENFKPPEKPSNEYSDDRKKDLYLRCREALVKGKRYFVIKDGRRLRAEEFVWWCMKDNPDRMLYIFQMCLDTPDDNTCYLLSQFFTQQIYLEEKGYWDAQRPANNR